MGRRSADSRCHLRNVPLFLPRGFPLARFRDTTAAAYLGGAGLFTLVLKRRDIVGGCCVTEEIAPGCRASTTSYIASMLRPEVIRDLELASHGLRMVPCDPMLAGSNSIRPMSANRCCALNKRHHSPTASPSSIGRLV